MVSVHFVADGQTIANERPRLRVVSTFFRKFSLQSLE